MEQKCENGTEVYRWNRTVKWNRSTQMEENCENGTAVYKWNRTVKMEQKCTNGIEL